MDQPALRLKLSDWPLLGVPDDTPAASAFLGLESLAIVLPMADGPRLASWTGDRSGPSSSMTLTEPADRLVRKVENR